MEKTQEISITELLIPFSIVIFVIAVGVILLYLQYKKNIIQKEFEKIILKSAQQEELLKTILITQEDERKRIAADIHDEIGATISIIKMNLALLDQKLKTAPNPVADHSASVENLISLSENAISSVRNISHQLMPPQLESFGLIKTLESVQNMINKAGDLKIEILITNDEYPEIPRPMALHLYRVIMELINNTIKHANATSININFTFHPTILHIVYQDNGIGLAQEKRGYFSGKGFQTIETRIGVLDGTVKYEAPMYQTGFVAVFDIPFKQ